MVVYLALTVLTIGMVCLFVRREETPVRSGRYTVIHRGMTRQQLVNRIVLGSLFLALFLVSALRLNVGNDYGNYVEFMHLAYAHAYVPTEWGFNNLTRLVYELSGFENYLAVFAIFAAVTIGLFLTALWQQSEDFVLSYMMFMLLGYYFQSISTVRYYLALSVALFAIRYVLRGDWPRFVLLVLAGALFHKSLLLVLLLYPVAVLRWRRWMFSAFGLVCLATLFLRGPILRIVLFLYPTYEDTQYLSGGTSIVSIARCLAVLAAALWLYRRDHGEILRDRRLRFFFLCNMMALALYTFGAFLPTVSRVAYYLTITQLFFVPLLLKQVPVQWRRTAVLMTAVACAGYFAIYMHGAGAPGVRILPYQTFLFHELPPMISERGGL